MRKYEIFKVLVISVFLFLSVSPGFGFSTDSNLISRNLDRHDTMVKGSINVIVSFSNAEPYDLRGFYFVEHIPEGLMIEPLKVEINGSEITNYLFERGSVGDVYPGTVPSRWILEIPPDFPEPCPVEAGSTVEIFYSISALRAGTFNLDEFHWVGYFQGGTGPAFGHSEESDRDTVEFRESFPWLLFYPAFIKKRSNL